MLISDRPNLQPIPSGWIDPIRDWELLQTSQGRTQRTVDTRIRHVRRLARELDVNKPEMVTNNDLIRWSEQQDWKPETRHSYHSSIRLFFRWQTDQKGTNDPSSTLGSIRRPTPPPRPAPENTIKTAISSSKSHRTTLILRLAAEVGLRASEIAQLRTDDITTEPDSWGTVLVHGKGGKNRILPVPPDILAEIHHQAPTGGFVFPGRINGHLSARWIGRLGSRALGEKCTLHTLRHRFATTGFRHSRDLIAVQRALGHESIETTKRYTQAAIDLKTLVQSTLL